MSRETPNASVNPAAVLVGCFALYCCGACAANDQSEPVASHATLSSELPTGMVARVGRFEISEAQVEQLRIGGDLGEGPRAIASATALLVDYAAILTVAAREGEIDDVSSVDLVAETTKERVSLYATKHIAALEKRQLSLAGQQAYFEAHRSELKAAPTRRTLQLVVPVRGAAPSSDWEAATSKLEAARQSSMTEQAYLAAAKAAEKKLLADDLGRPIRKHRGDKSMRLERFTYMADTGPQSHAALEGFWGTEFAEAVFSAPVGSMGPVVRTQWGMHGLWVVSEDAPEEPTFADVQAQLVTTIRAEIAEQWIASIREKAGVVRAAAK